MTSQKRVVKVPLPPDVDPAILKTSETLWRRIEASAALLVRKTYGVTTDVIPVHVISFALHGPEKILAMRSIHNGRLSSYAL